MDTRIPIYGSMGGAAHPKKGEVAYTKKNYRKARTVQRNLAGPGPKKAPEPPVMIEKNCTNCGETFTTDSKWRSLCPGCTNHEDFLAQVGKCILGNMDSPKVELDPETLYDDLMIKVAYKARSKSHANSGYCSDHDSSKVQTTIFTKTLDLPFFKKFKKLDYDFNTNGIRNLELLNACYKPKDSYNCNCRDGEIVFQIESAIIFKKADAIVLDD